MFKIYNIKNKGETKVEGSPYRGEIDGPSGELFKIFKNFGKTALSFTGAVIHGIAHGIPLAPQSPPNEMLE